MKKKSIQKRVFKFYDDKDFNYDMSLVDEFFTDDIRFKIMLYRVDVNKSKVTNIYNESKAKDKKFLTPVEINIATSEYAIENNFLTKGGIFNENIKEFKLSILMSELEQKNITINRGDFFKWNDGQVERVFKINSLSNINSDNTAYGYKPFYITLECQLSKENITLI